jgi:hypothetical protein
MENLETKTKLYGMMKYAVKFEMITVIKKNDIVEITESLENNYTIETSSGNIHLVPKNFIDIIPQISQN